MPIDQPLFIQITDDTLYTTFFPIDLYYPNV